MSNLNGNTKVRGRALPEKPSVSSVIIAAGKSLACKAFACLQALPEPIRTRPWAILSYRHPSRFWYGKSARGKWNPAYRVIEGMKHNEFVKSGKITPKFPPMMPPVFPSIVNGIMSAVTVAKEKALVLAEMIAPRVEARAVEAEGIMHVAFIPREDAAAVPHTHDPVPFADAHPQADNVFQLAAHPGFRPEISLIHHGHHDGGRAEVIQLSVHPDYQPRLEAAPEAHAHHRHGTGHSIPFDYQPESAWATFVPNRRAPGAAPPEDAADIRHAPATRHHPVPMVTAHHEAGHRPEAHTPVAHMGSRRIRAAGAARPSIQEAPLQADAPGHSIAPRHEEVRTAAEGLSNVVPLFDRHAPAEPAVRKHVGYIPSTRRRSLQLKVAVGAEGIPPQ